MNIHHRYMLRGDMPTVLAIEDTVYEFPWNDVEFVKVCRQRNSVPMVVEVDGRVAGYYVYELHTVRYHLLNMAVAPAYQRKGVGTSIITRLKDRTHWERRSRVVCEVRETNLDALLFFKANGLRALSVLRGFYDRCGEDAYLMMWRCAPVGAVSAGLAVGGNSKGDVHE